MDISKYINKDMKICFYTEDMIQNLTEDKIKEIINKEEVYQIEEIGSHFIIYDDFYVDLDLIIYHTIFMKNNEVIDMSALRKEFEELYPNHNKFNIKVINEFIKKGYQYIFYPYPIQEINLENIDKNKMFTVTHIDIDGICSEGGFLDMEDTLFKCIFFDFEGNKVDLTPLQNLYKNRWT